MKAIILAAGQGKRLSPITDNRPKCMVELEGKTLLEWQLMTLKSSGIEDIVVIRGYRGDMINYPNVKYYENPNFENTNMVETLFCAEQELEDSVIICYGDIIYEKNVLEKLIASEDDFSVVVDKKWKEYWKMRFENILDDAESLVLDESGFITDIGQKETQIDKIDGQYIGLMKFQGEALEFIKRFYKKCRSQARPGFNPLNPNLEFEKSYMTDFLQGLIREGCKLRAIMIENGWLEVDTINDYNLYSKFSRENRLNQFIKLETVR